MHLFSTEISDFPKFHVRGSGLTENGDVDDQVFVIPDGSGRQGDRNVRLIMRSVGKTTARHIDMDGDIIAEHEFDPEDANKFTITYYGKGRLSGDVKGSEKGGENGDGKGTYKETEKGDEKTAQEGGKERKYVIRIKNEPDNQKNCEWTMVVEGDYKPRARASEYYAPELTKKGEEIRDKISHNFKSLFHHNKETTKDKKQEQKTTESGRRGIEITFYSWLSEISGKSCEIDKHGKALYLKFTQVNNGDSSDSHRSLANVLTLDRETGLEISRVGLLAWIGAIWTSKIPWTQPENKGGYSILAPPDWPRSTDWAP